MKTISNYLSSIKDLLEKRSLPIASIVVTDNSWALIGAVMKTFNNTDPGKYLIWAYHLLVKDARLQLQLSSYMKTRLVICSTHYLKNLIKETKNIKTESGNKKTFIFCFTLLQDSTTIEQMKLYLKRIFLVFNSRFFTKSVDNSIKVSF